MPLICASRHEEGETCSACRLSEAEAKAIEEMQARSVAIVDGITRPLMERHEAQLQALIEQMRQQVDEARDWQWEARTLRRVIDAEREQTRREFAEADAKLGALYAERNALAVAFATAMTALGYRAGYGLEAEADAEWPVLYVQTPAGQVSWHLPKAEATHSRIALGVYGEPWDGHSTALKYQRLASLNPYTLRTAPLLWGRRHSINVAE